MSRATASDRELRIERVLDAPRDLVFKMWTDPGHYRNWAAPKGFTVEHLEWEARVGGIYRICLRSPDGEDYWVRGSCRDIKPPELLVFSSAWENEDGSTGPETIIRVTFEDLGSQTKLTLHQAEFDSVESRDGHASGWSETLERLPDYLATVVQ